ncbi:rhodanese-like domain-containing protein [Rossellomorea marisflavi]|uniref:rhodanese-like domain-containing protein n=1 Tax=Rossellomorea marisflavi TaxID=189381 RepID=UPI0028533FA5|nr:rhodanese-like domain-containing protein [Rossellomorea marisflavi]MDR4938779.1 rhodanese-like domain-containing protein [Rossellomorea marisflavi]
MQIILYALLAIVLVLILSRLMPVKGIRMISTEELKRELKNKNKQFIDVRTPGEYKGNHIRGFKNIPLQQLPKQIATLSKDKEVVVICQSGMRSMNAAKLLRKSGFHSVTNVKGGMNAWRS